MSKEWYNERIDEWMANFEWWLGELVFEIEQNCPEHMREYSATQAATRLTWCLELAEKCAYAER